ncbi:MAG: enoyl-CoA hydratase [Hyphomicrobiales bacterium]|nr:MAG: enoyl-CoA hydratase [Hyphomicrobiales bacterium]
MSTAADAATTPAAANDEPLVLREDDDGVTILTLNRPRALNALSLPLLHALREALDDIREDKSVRAVILRGAGRGFCAGHDLKEITSHRDDPDGGRAFFETLFASCTDTMMAIRNLPVVVIAEVQGIATAAGCQLLSTCDMAVASTESKFGVNGVDAGLFCSTPMVALSRNVPRKVAMQMLTLGHMIGPDDARTYGLVNEVVAPDELADTAMAMARRAAQKSRAVVALGKEAFYRQVELGVEDAYSLMGRVIVDNLMMRDAEIGIACFIGKEKPEWEDR